MNGSKPYGLSGSRRVPSPKRRRPRLRAFRSPSPRPSPPGEGDRRLGVGKFGRCGCSPRFLVSRFRGIRQPTWLVSPKHGQTVLPLLGERAGVRGNEANSNPRRTALPGTVILRESPAEPGFPNLMMKQKLEQEETEGTEMSFNKVCFICVLLFKFVNPSSRWTR